VTAFWLVAGAAVTLWAYGEHRKQRAGVAQGLESALRRREAAVIDVRAEAFAELEEIEDEGACYAFQLPGERLLFLAGQELYESARFPSLDFSLVHVLDQAGRAVDVVIEKRGAKAAPERKIPAAVKATLDVPGHLELRTGRIGDLERLLAR
jgi:hypothetical protein